MTAQQFQQALAAALAAMGLKSTEDAPDQLGRHRSRVYEYLAGTQSVPEDVEIRLYAMRDAPKLYKRWLKEARC